MQRLRPAEFFLIELLFYSILWLWSDYIATLVSTIFFSIALFIFLISLITEWIEPSKVPSWYYQFMIASILAPLICAAIFIGLGGANFDWSY